jgi:hypothetical protein
MHRDVPDALRRISAELVKPVPAGIYAIAKSIVTNHVRGVAAVLAYGSCIRDASLEESLIDLYVLTRRLEDVSTSIVSRLACRLLPPNVYYAECSHAGQTLRSKFAVMTLSDFAAQMKSSTRMPYFWARFAQPSRLVYAADETCRRHVEGAIAEAAFTMLRESRQLAPPSEDPLHAITRCLKASYATELRAEKSGRAESIVAATRSYYGDLSELVETIDLSGDKTMVERLWRRRQAKGKLLSVARLIKAGFTFEGGADYLAWKIRRHSGEVLVMSSWHRRHPVLTGLMLLPKMLRKGAVR